MEGTFTAGQVLSPPRPLAARIWIAALATVITAMYVAALAAHLATIALGRDPLSLPTLAWRSPTK